MCPPVVVCWLHLLGAFGPIAGDENLACFECLPFASFRFLQSLYSNSWYSVSQVFFSLWPSMVTVVLMRFLLAYRLRVVLPLAERRRFRCLENGRWQIRKQ